jgi:hypothetical protein
LNLFELQLFVPRFLMQTAVFDIVHRNSKSHQEGAVLQAHIEISATFAALF